MLVNEYLLDNNIRVLDNISDDIVKKLSELNASTLFSQDSLVGRACDFKTGSWVRVLAWTLSHSVE